METGDGLLARVRAPRGRLSLGQAAALADAAIACGNGAIGLTARANLLLRGLSETTLPDLRERLEDAELIDADPEVERLRKKTRLIFVDFHAEATSEKIALARMLDGQVSAVVGTHTHVQTADEQIFPGYTFSWSPEPLQLIAFRSPAGRLTIMNGEGETETVGDSKDVWLPAWSESGDWIAYLQRTGRKKFVLKVVSYS